MADAGYAKLSEETKIEIKDITEPADCCSSAGYINCYHYALRCIQATLLSSEPHLTPICGGASCGTTGWYQSALWFYSLASLVGTLITVTNSIGFCVTSGGQYWQVSVIWFMCMFILLPHAHAVYVLAQHAKLVAWADNLRLLCMNIDFGTTNRFFKVTLQSLSSLTLLSLGQRQALVAFMQERRLASFTLMVYQPVWKSNNYDRPRRWIHWIVFLNIVAWILCIVAYFKIGLS